MIRGTTAQFRFKLPCVKGRLAWATIKFWQPGNNGVIEAPLPITKRLTNCLAVENDESIAMKKWDSGEYEDIKIKYDLPRNIAWAELTDGNVKNTFAKWICDEILITLEAEETLRFSDKSKAKVQLRAAQEDGATFGSREQSITVYPINDDIITDDPSLPIEEEGLIVLNGGQIA